MVLNFMYVRTIARTVFADFPNLMIQRGNWREPVFLKDEDRMSHLKTINNREATPSYEKIVVADCVDNYFKVS